jgi:hypothetical protein
MARTEEDSREKTDAPEQDVSDEARDEEKAASQAPDAEAEEPQEQDTKAQAAETEQAKSEDSDAQDSADDDSDSEDKAETNSVGTDTGSPGRDPDKPMSDAQRTYLEPLAESQNEEVRDDMNEAEAAGAIDRLQENAVHVY